MGSSNHSQFHQDCWELLKKIPEGKVTTYGEIARALGTKAYQAVGSAMNKNPLPVVVPCHRVISSNGKMGGYAYGVDRKIELLKSEGVEIHEDQIDLDEYLFRF